MFLRMVAHIIRPDEGEKMAADYAKLVQSALRSTPGCVFASLLQSTSNAQECISLTIWKSRKESTEYEQGGLYAKLVDSLRPHFAESTEYKLGLSEDLSLEYTPIQVEPIVERFEETDGGSENISKLKVKPYAVQILSLTVQEDRIGAFGTIFATEIHPRYKAHKGFIDLILLREQQKFHAISFWDETVDIETSTGIHSITQLLVSIYRVLPSYVRWRVAHAGPVHTSASSDDVRAVVYRCLTAEWFVH